MDDESWHLVKSHQQGHGFVGGANRPPRSPRRGREDRQPDGKASDKPRPKVEFDRRVVRVRKGRSPTSTAAVEDVNYEKVKVRVSVTIFGRATPVELDFRQVEKVKPVGVRGLHFAWLGAVRFGAWRIQGGGGLCRGACTRKEHSHGKENRRLHQAASSGW